MKIFLTTVAAVLFLAGILSRLAGLENDSWDMKLFVLRWYGQLAQQGFGALGTDFSNYTPPYLYLLWVATAAKGLLADLTAIKSVSLLFDLGNAAWVYRIARIKYSDGPVPLLGAAIFFCLPTVVFNSAWWGQADGIYTFFVLGCFYYIVQERPFLAVVLFGIAVSFKLLAIFLAPFLFILVIKGRIPWHYFLLVPLVYVALIAPAVLAGRPFLDALTIYFAQAGTFHQLTMNAPNLYVFISNEFYRAGVLFGLGFTALLALGWSAFYARTIKIFTPEIMAICAAASVLLVPYFLPKMHERYFYLADAFLLISAIYTPRLWFLVLVSQAASGLTYSLYLFKPDIAPGVLLTVAAQVNTGLMAMVFWEQYRLVRKSDPG